MIVMVTAKGTACAETGLCSTHDSSANKTIVAASADPDAAAWIHDVTNPEIHCSICGVTAAHDDPTSPTQDDAHHCHATPRGGSMEIKFLVTYNIPGADVESDDWNEEEFVAACKDEIFRSSGIAPETVERLTE